MPTSKEEADEVNDNSVTCNRVMAYERGSDCSRNIAFVTTSQTKEEISSKVVKMMFEADFSEKDRNSQALSQDDRREEAVNLIKDAKEMCRKGGFGLHKIASNKKEVIDAIPAEERAEEIRNKEFDSEALPIERTLGVEWCVDKDSFQFRITLKDRPCTRRGILSTVSSIYDPLGFVAPLLLEGKKILQDLCREKTDWDDPVPEVVKMKWEKWRRELFTLDLLAVPRCSRPSDFGCISSVGCISSLTQVPKGMANAHTSA